MNPTYTVKIKKFGFSKKLKNVKGDGITETGTHRYFVLIDDTRIEVPVWKTTFIFSPERFLVVRANMEKESGQAVR